MQTPHPNEVLNLVNSAIQNLHLYAGSGCPRAERQARLVIEHLEHYSADPAIVASCCALEQLLEAVSPK